MSRRSRASLIVATVVVIVFLATLAFAWRPAMPLIDAMTGKDIDGILVVKGANLAAIGNCTSCHTSAGGIPFAGGVPLATPFGTIHGTNITPDRRTGIGTWSEAAFVRAMREGVSRDGHLLYPAFPYTHFAGTTDADLHALYAFLGSRDAAMMEPTANGLLLPLRWRPLVAGWDALFLREEPTWPSRPVDPVAARGTYLATTLAHCGSCHTPRNVFAAEKSDASLDGAVIDGWYAPPLNGRSPSPVVWSLEAMTQYLRTGLVEDHAIAAGPMQTVVASYADADAGDVAALAAAVVSAMGPVSDERSAREVAARQRASKPLTQVTFETGDAQLALGAAVYASACASCHDRGREVASNSGLRMPLAVALYEDEPLSLLRVVREGVIPADGRRSRWMPAFGTSLTDEQLVALLTYLRHVAADSTPWPRLENAVAATRR